MKTTPKPISDKQNYPKILFVENVGDDTADEFLVSADVGHAIDNDETQCEVAVYKFEKMVVVTREEKIVITDK